MSALLLGLVLLTGAASLDPVEASKRAPAAVGLGDLAAEVVEHCRVESRCRAIGLHDEHGDVGRRSGETFAARARRVGWIDPRGCELHAETGERWGIRGAHGHAAAYAVRWLGSCVAPEALDIPYLSAVAAARRLDNLRRRYRRRSRASRAHAWRHGVGCRCGRATT